MAPRPLWSGPRSEWPGPRRARAPTGSRPADLDSPLGRWSQHPGSGNRGEPPPLSAGDTQEGAVCCPRADCDQLSRLVIAGRRSAQSGHQVEVSCARARVRNHPHGGAIVWGIHLVESRGIDEYGCHCSSRRFDMTEDPTTVRRLRVSGVSYLGGRQDRQPTARVLGIRISDYQRNA